MHKMRLLICLESIRKRFYRKDFLQMNKKTPIVVFVCFVISAILLVCHINNSDYNYYSNKNESRVVTLDYCENELSKAESGLRHHRRVRCDLTCLTDYLEELTNRVDKLEAEVKELKENNKSQQMETHEEIISD